VECSPIAQMQAQRRHALQLVCTIHCRTQASIVNQTLLPPIIHTQ